jgi:hypothetical protein
MVEGAPALAPAAQSSAPKSMGVLGVLGIGVCVILAIAVAFTKPLDEQGTPAFLQGIRIGTLIGMLLLPFLIAYAIAGRKKARNPRAFAVIFCIVCLLGLGSSLVSSLSFETPEHRIARLAREAAGLQPERHTGFARQRKFDDAVRNQYRNLVQQNRTYMESIKNIDMSQLKMINSAESFATPGAATEARRELHALYDLDAAQEDKVKEILGNLRRTMESEASSASERESMLQGFDKGTAEAAAKRQHALDSEKVWIDAVDDLYAYAEMHQGGFSLSNGHLIIPDAVIRNEFNSKMEYQGEQRKAFLQAQKEFSQFQGQSLDKLGLTPKDVGVK